jgi:hypothetical protein
MERRVCLLANRREIWLSTNPVFPPIPTRAYDWSAIDANTHDVGGYDGETGCAYTTSPQGSGETEQEVIDSLFTELEEDSDYPDPYDDSYEAEMETERRLGW